MSYLDFVAALRLNKRTVFSSQRAPCGGGGPLHIWFQLQQMAACCRKVGVSEHTNYPDRALADQSNQASRKKGRSSLGRQGEARHGPR
jgi:hypothetical protein